MNCRSFHDMNAPSDMAFSERVALEELRRIFR